jgi:hypothetical protein
MQSVVSSNLRTVGYDAASSTLRVSFRNGGLYEYQGVPDRVHRGLMAASSHGTYFHAHIRDRYPTKKVR